MKSRGILFMAAASALCAVLKTSGATHYVNINNLAPTPPYTSWETAATNIQHAIDAAMAGDEVLVTNGVYRTGRSLASGMANRVLISKPLTMRSVNGPEVTTIVGEGPAGPNAVRCVFLSSGAVLEGFTLTQGATQLWTDNMASRSGGGVWCESLSAIVSNCVLTSNSAFYGGGAYSGTLINCTLTSNSAPYGGGTSESTLNNCTLTHNSASESGGGTAGGVLDNCTLTNNSAGLSGGGASGGKLNNCSLIDNWARIGGGVSSGTLTNCSLTGNSAVYGGGANGAELNNCILSGSSADDGGGAYLCTLTNCTLIDNKASSIGGGAYGGKLVQCVLSNNSASFFGGGGAYWSALNNCTLIGNHAQDGGGANSSTLASCTLKGNLAWSRGGGATDSDLKGCFLSENSAITGGGAYAGTLTNCTLTGNTASEDGGGASGGSLKNCLVYYNTAPRGANFLADAATNMNYCCTTPLPPRGIGNITDEPQLVIEWRLSANSPCISAGDPAYATGQDLDGEPWANPPAIGCDQYRSGSLTGAVSVAIVTLYTDFATGFAVDFRSVIDGRADSSRWDFGDGMVVSNRVLISHAWSSPGDYPVTLKAYNESHPEGISTTVTVQVVDQPVHFVALDSANPTPPYSTWATAATNIQDAVDAATIGGVVWVTNGVYQTGERLVYGMANRVAISAPITVRSVNGPEVTAIVGAGPQGSNAVRCVYLTSGAMLAGFTLTNGATQVSGQYQTNLSGGGAWCESVTAMITNCVLAGNSASSYGGGAYSGTLINCKLTGNSASLGGGVAESLLNNCTLMVNSASYSGGGGESSTLSNCTLTGNSAKTFGGGASGCHLNNCMLTENVADSGGGAAYSTLNNCTLTGNSAFKDGGGASGGTLNNCIVYYNTAPDGLNHSYSVLNYCCTLPLAPSGTGNITLGPLFVDQLEGDFRLQAGSPCIDAGNNSYASGLTDLGGLPRIVGGSVDIGAYEFQYIDPFYAWLAHYGLPTDGSADNADADQDGMTQRQEWFAGTDPTNDLSVLRMSSAAWTASGVEVTWLSVTNRTYTVERATNLGAAPAFLTMTTNIAGWPNSTSWLDTNASRFLSGFYRVRVEKGVLGY